MVPVFAGIIFFYTHERDWLRQVALAIYVVSAASDVLDGYLARRLGQSTRLGARLDPLADKLIVNLGFVFMAANRELCIRNGAGGWSPAVPMWFPVVVLVRDVIIVLGAQLIKTRYGNVTVKPLWSGKMTTVFQMATIIAILIPVDFARYLLWAALAATVISGAHYIVHGLAEARQREAA